MSEENWQARAQTAEAALKQAAETYVVALDVAEQSWRKELAEAEAALTEAKAALRSVANVADLAGVSVAIAALDRIDQHPTQEAVTHD